MPGSCRRLLLLYPALAREMYDSMVFIWANWSMTCWSTEECPETVLGLVTEGCIVVSDCMLISILSVSVEPLEMLCAEAADALASWAGDLKAEYLLSAMRLICIFKKLYLFLFQFCLSVISFGA